MTSTKPTKIKHFTTFYTIKNHHYSTLKSPQSLENKTFSRTQQKITYLIRKFHLTNHIKSNLKISKTPVKSILFNHSKSTNNTTLSKSYFLLSNLYTNPHQIFHISHSYLTSENYYLILFIQHTPNIPYLQFLD